MSETSPFDPTDPFNSQCERLRREVIQLVIDSEKVTLYREMDSKRQLECLVAGLMTGLIGAAFASVAPTADAQDYVTEYIASCIPVARQFAEAMDPRGKAA